MKKIIHIKSFILLLIAVGLMQCAKKYDDIEVDNQMVIDSIRPERGTENTPVRIYGRNFPEINNQAVVFFNNKQGTIVGNSTSNVILTSVPSEAGTGNVSLKIGAKVISGPVFTYDYEAPIIAGISPLTGVAGTEITINGSKFSTVAANNEVSINGIKAAVTASSVTQLKAILPYTKNGAVQVKANGVGNIGAVFRFVPYIENIDKNTAFEGDMVRLTGKYFDAGATPVVTFNGVNAAVVSASSTTLDVRVPASSNGNIIVTVDGINSNPIAFTYLRNIVANSLNQTSPVLRTVSGIDGASVSIKGGSFGTDASRIRVTVGTQNAQVTAVADDNVTFTVPNFVSSQENTQQIKIFLQNVEASYPNGNLSFTYLEPVILSATCTIVPLTAGLYNFIFNVSGNHFNATAPNANFELLIDGANYGAAVNGNAAVVTTTQSNSFIKNRYDIRVNNKWGSFILAFQRNINISDFNYASVNGSRTITITGDGFGSVVDQNRSVRVYRIQNGVKNYLNVQPAVTWSDNQLVATFTDNYIDDLTYGVEVRVNSRMGTKEKFFNYFQVN
ncbi:IPT/TIG domain-containing protein [Pedobacter sp.]|uniref:IPT/TIG domain-containing protein n=1 Tax=Pedobacter sp. TaxID=1411316 RepID=UPI0031E41F21